MKVVSHHWLESRWSQKKKLENKHLAPTVRAPITQFNSVANCTLSICLNDPSVVAQDRAGRVENFIMVAGFAVGSPAGSLSGALTNASAPFSAIRIEFCSLSLGTVPGRPLPGAH